MVGISLRVKDRPRTASRPVPRPYAGRAGDAADRFRSPHTSHATEAASRRVLASRLGGARQRRSTSNTAALDV